MTRIFLAALLLLPAAALADLDAGNWELSVTSSFAGMPTPVGPVVQQHCFTAADVRNPHRILGSAATSGCAFTNQRDTGSQMSFDLKCSGQVPMQGSGVVHYTRDTMDADISLDGEANGQKFSTRSKISGRRLGAC